MLYHSTNNNSPEVDFREATIRGLAPDKGLYFPKVIPDIPKGFLKDIGKYSKEEVAFTVIEPYVGDTIPKKDLKRIVSETVSFDFPLRAINERVSVLELFHGPTLAFKDVGARFMSRCLGHFVKGENKKITVLVATSGDTGGAVANGFYDVQGIDVIILYPSGKVSSIQEAQLTSLGKNISALEIAGTFDDCQAMVKRAFADEELTARLFLTSANSINIARWLPQQFYYFFAYQQWKESTPPIFSVPSGNFGNVSAGMLAYKSGLPVAHFIAACNSNDVMSSYLQSGEYTARESVATMSNAMDVGDPSNFVRIREMYKEDPDALRKILYAASISDTETTSCIRDVYADTKYLLDPHGAVGYAALINHLNKHPGQKGILLETAHPVKFFDIIEPIIGEEITMPGAMADLLKMTKKSRKMNTDYTSFKKHLLSGSR